MKQERNSFHLSTEMTAEAFFGGKVIKLVSRIKQTYHGNEPEAVAYLRLDEFEALTAWLYYISCGRDEKSPELSLDNNHFDFGYKTSKEEKFADTAGEILKKIAFGTVNGYHSPMDKVLVNQQKDLAILPSGMSYGTYHLIRVISIDFLEQIVQRPHYQIEKRPAYKSLSEESVTLADRLSAIIGMSTAPDKGYEVVLRNGIGELKLLESAARSELSTIVEDLIR